MVLAKNNITIKLDKQEPFGVAILNPVAGNFDIMDEAEYREYEKLERGEAADPELTEYLLERGYLYPDQKSKKEAEDAAFEAFRQEADKGQIQLMLIPTYSCNLACTYCFQHGIDGRPELISAETVDAFFEYIREEYKDASPKPFITLFGGEPLINSPAQRKIIQQIVDRCVEEDYELSAVTNGYDFADYAEMLSKAKIKEIQFTLDGSQRAHDQRRITANGRGSYDKVLQGMEAAVAAGMPVNLRSVTDRENIDSLVEMAEVLEEKGWLDLPPEKFKTQIGRNYELFECYEKPAHLFSQVEMWGYVAQLAKEHPVMKKFHRPDFMGLRYLVDTGEMYLASFDTCPAAKTEWVFDLHGEIYGCTASCGREEFRLGTFWPERSKDDRAIDKWKTRNVRNIEKCQSCKYDVICGGGCGVLAANQNGGEIHSPDCRPVGELYEIGLDFYGEEILALADSQPEEEPEGRKPEPGHGCLICGEPLEFRPGAVSGHCEICGVPMTSNILCQNGHMVCDRCHNGDTLEHMTNLLLDSTQTHPVRLAEAIFAMPTMKMHGPEHHSMVPGVLETTWQNIQGTRDAGKIKEAIARGQDIKGGSCGFHGNCGACVGAGIAESIHLGARPASREERGKALQATAKALMDVSQYGGPLCCKRDSITSILSYMEGNERYASQEPYDFICSYSKYNKGCLKTECPYFPKKGNTTENANGAGK